MAEPNERDLEVARDLVDVAFTGGWAACPPRNKSHPVEECRQCKMAHALAPYREEIEKVSWDEGYVAGRISAIGLQEGK